MRGWSLAVCALGAVGLSADQIQAQFFPIVINECSTGTSGWLELVNLGPAPLDLARDPERCWLIDDTEGGGQPKAISDSNVVHAPGSTTCSSLGRPAMCGVIQPGEFVSLKYAFVNATTADECRLLSAPRVGESCGAPASNANAGGPTSSKTAGSCFGRTPDGGWWSAASLGCTRGAANGGCEPSASCDDGNPCTSGEVYSSTCSCGGGAAADGVSCGSGNICQATLCRPAPSADAVVARRGTSGLLLAGTIVTPDTVIEGEVLIVGDEIRCVAESCTGAPEAATATFVQTNGIIIPGLIDSHNHIQFDIFDESDWAPKPTDNFEDHDDWPRNAQYKALVDCKQYLNGEAHSPVNIGCELEKYGELKGLISGTTSILGATNPSDLLCFGSLARTIEQRPNGLAADKVQNATPFPSKATADTVCRNLGSGKTDAYLIHCGEGINDTAHREFQKLFDITSTPGCLYSAKTAIVHGTALREADFDTMQDHGMGLVWSPRSNVFLYGHGTDLTKTTNIPAALERNVTVALAPDWSIGGSQNLLDELRFADFVDNQQWGDVLSPAALVAMVTKNPARLLGLESTIGRLAPGFKADIVVIAGNRAQPYPALLQATPKTVRLVLVGGKVLYGDSSLRTLTEPAPECETLDICGASKFACVAASGGTTANKLGQSYAQIREIIETELKNYDDKNLTAWDFMPLAPLYRCDGG